MSKLENLADDEQFLSLVMESTGYVKAEVLKGPKTIKVIAPMDVDLKDVVTLDVFGSKDKKVTASKDVKARFEEMFKTGKNRWFFSKLRF